MRGLYDKWTVSPAAHEGEFIIGSIKGDMIAFEVQNEEYANHIVELHNAYVDRRWEERYGGSHGG